MSTMMTKEPGATGSPPADGAAQESPLRRYCFNAERVVETTESAQLSEIATSEEEAWDKAQAQLDDGDVDWDEEESNEGEADLSLASTERLTDEEIEEYLEELRVEGEAVSAAEQGASRSKERPHSPGITASDGQRRGAGWPDRRA